MSKQEMNTSGKMLLDIYGIAPSYLKMGGFIQCYLRDSIRPADSSYITLSLLFHPEDNQQDMFHDLMSEYNDMQVLVDVYNHDEGYHVAVLKIPQDYEHDFELFLQGKYGDFSSKLISCYMMYITRVDQWGNTEQILSPQYRIVNRDENVLIYCNNYKEGQPIADGEVWPIPDLNKETLIIALIEQEEKTKIQ